VFTEEEQRQQIYGLINDSQFMRYLDLDFIELSRERAYARMKLDSRYVNGYGTMHGGVIYSLADTIAGSLANMSGNMCTTVDGYLNYYEPVINTEYVYCEATITKAGRNLINVKVNITNDDGKILDDGVFNYFRMRGDISTSSK